MRHATLLLFIGAAAAASLACGGETTPPGQDSTPTDTDSAATPPAETGAAPAYFTGTFTRNDDTFVSVMLGLRINLGGDSSTSCTLLEEWADAGVVEEPCPNCEWTFASEWSGMPPTVSGNVCDQLVGIDTNLYVQYVFDQQRWGFVPYYLEPGTDNRYYNVVYWSPGLDGDDWYRIAWNDTVEENYPTGHGYYVQTDADSVSFRSNVPARMVDYYRY